MNLILFIESNPTSNWSTQNLAIGIIPILLMLYFFWYKKSKQKPTMPPIGAIFDEYGGRLLFTIISNNSAGSRIDNLHISKRFLKIFFINKTRICYQVYSELTHPKPEDEIIEYSIKNQQTFTTVPNGDHLLEEGIYKLTFSTSDGVCSNFYLCDLSSLTQLSVKKCR